MPVRIRIRPIHVRISMASPSTKQMKIKEIKGVRNTRLATCPVLSDSFRSRDPGNKGKPELKAPDPDGTEQSFGL